MAAQPKSLPGFLNGLQQKQGWSQAINNDNSTSIVNEFRSSRKHVRGFRGDSVDFAGSGAIGSAALTVDGDVPEGWTVALGKLVTMPLDPEGLFAMKVDGNLSISGASMFSEFPGAILGGQLVVEVIVYGDFGVEYARIPVLATSSTLWEADPDLDTQGTVTFSDRNSKIADVILLPSVKFGVRLEMSYDVASDPDDLAGTFALGVTLTHIPITRFA